MCHIERKEGFYCETSAQEASLAVKKLWRDCRYTDDSDLHTSILIQI